VFVVVDMSFRNVKRLDEYNTLIPQDGFAFGNEGWEEGGLPIPLGLQYNIKGVVARVVQSTTEP